jgi:hypothetical protein
MENFKYFDILSFKNDSHQNTLSCKVLGDEIIDGEKRCCSWQVL